LLEKHKSLCHYINKYCVTLPQETEKYLSFKNHRYQEKVPFVIYADLESILEKVKEKVKGKNISYETRSTPYQKHTACSIAYYFKCSYDDSLSKFSINRGRDCIEWFVNELKNIAHFCDDQFKTIIPMTKLNEIKANCFLALMFVAFVKNHLPITK
jgi:hypothetical protein